MCFCSIAVITNMYLYEDVQITHTQGRQRGGSQREVGERDWVEAGKGGKLGTSVLVSTMKIKGKKSYLCH